MYEIRNLEVMGGTILETAKNYGNNSLNYAGHLVFGLDIGTRSIVGTIGYKEEDQ